MSAERGNRRILLADDSPAIHADFQKILAPVATGAGAALANARAAFTGEAVANDAPAAPRFELESALQGQEALEHTHAALEEGRPFAMAFVDVRMPPGWDGIETIERLWEVDGRVQVVICTAYSDHTWTETFERLGRPDNLLILKKPFDPVEVLQLASALTEKWNVTSSMERLLETVRAAEREARSYASSLETVNRALEASKAAAERNSAMKTELLVRLSDEVAGKVGAVIGHVEHARGLPAGDEELVEQLESIFTSGRHLADTLDDVVDLTRLEAGDLDLERRECSPAELAREVAERFAEQASAQGIALGITVAEDVPPRLQTDPGRVGQVLGTLVENALGHTEQGTVRLDVGVEATDDWRSSIVIFTVSDTGCGVCDEKLPALFEPFGCRRESGGGGGLSLAFSRRIARSLGGDITVARNESRGASFTLKLAAGERRSIGA
ncbi:MAG: hypothetical protein CMJ84_17655 [Planctomycetes bacterium]|nr:hypothetical protein [Planctomycetota bacterium]MDP6409919.1 ATP-binding protein [Planctomycetota bacterium]